MNHGKRFLANWGFHKRVALSVRVFWVERAGASGNVDVRETSLPTGQERKPSEKMVSVEPWYALSKLNFEEIRGWVRRNSRKNIAWFCYNINVHCRLCHNAQRVLVYPCNKLICNG